MTRLKTAFKWLDEHAEKPVIVIACVSACLLISYQVFARYFLGTWLKINVDTSMVEELAVFAFIWAIYFATPLVFKRGEQIRLSAFTDWIVPEKYQSFMSMFNNVVSLALTILIMCIGVRLFRLQLQFPQETPTLNIPYAIPYSVLIVGFLLMSIRIVQLCVRLIRQDGILRFFAQWLWQPPSLHRFIFVILAQPPH